MNRTKEEINNEYHEVCAYLGHRLYQKALLDTEIENLFSKIKLLDAEHKTILDSEKKEK